MIICASRRTDIPAYHAEWLMNRLRAGYAMVRNPMVKNLVYRVDLTRPNVDALVFMSKDPRPLMPFLKEIGQMRYIYLFQITLTPYGRDLEPRVPFKADIADAFRALADRIGADRTIWRYDPVIMSDMMDVKWHRRKFELLCRELEGSTRRCIFSFVDLYGRTDRTGLRLVTAAEADAMGAMMAPIAAAHGIQLSYCCPRFDLTRYGIESRGCLDGRQMAALDIPYEDLTVPLRAGCRCVKNIDIGAYNTCAHDCRYCYANDPGPATRALHRYDPTAEMLYGQVTPDDRVVPLSRRQDARLSDYFDYKQY